MTKHTRTIASVVSAGALLAAPVAALAAPGQHGHAKADRRAANCARTHSVGFSAVGTLVSFTADDPATPASEATVTMTVLAANAHARRSGEIADQDAAKPGVQARGATLTVPAGDAFVVRLRGYQGTDSPSAGDRVKVNGRIARTARKCAAAGTSTADRFGALDVRRVTIADRDPDA